MRKAASRENFMLRVQDIPAVLNQLAAWNSTLPLKTDQSSEIANGPLR